MSGIGRMEKLLEGAAVEWKPLGEVGEFVRGNGLQKKDFAEMGFPAIHYGQIHTKFGFSADKTLTFVSEELGSKLRKANKNDLLLATTSESDEDVAKPLAWLGDEIGISGDMMLFRHEQNVKYLAYYFQTEAFKVQKRKYVNGIKVRRISKENLAKIVVPIPDVVIQNEIAKTLDSFSVYNARLNGEFTAEIVRRQKQYAYYREQLLTFQNEQVDWKPLVEVATIGTGSRNTNEAIVGGKYPFFVRSQRARAIDEFEFDETAIITAGDGVGVGKVFHYMSGKYALHQRAYRIVLTDSNVKSRFVFHYIRNNFGQYLKTTSVHASVTSLRKPMFEKYPVPLPPLKEQERIICILDKFEELTNSVTEALNNEIELRRKQYKYHRDLLLSFPMTEVKVRE